MMHIVFLKVALECRSRKRGQEHKRRLDDVLIALLEVLNHLTDSAYNLKACFQRHLLIEYHK
jgi:hypothetical protein